MSDFDVFRTTPGGVINWPEEARRLEQARLERQAALVAGLGHPAGRALLDALLAREYARPSYMPGDDFPSTAYRQGRIAVLRELAEQLHAAAQPSQTGE